MENTTQVPSGMEKIRQSYLDYILKKGERPFSVYQLSQDLNMDEETFYQYFASLGAVERSVWQGFLEQTLERLQKDASYAEFTAREKLLAFFYTLIEVLKKNRSYVVFCLKNLQKLRFFLTVGSDFREQLGDYARQLIQEGIEGGEVISRLYISQHYHRALWWQLATVLYFWIKDESQDFERTDAFIEKSVHFKFDILGHTPIDSAWDMARFLFQEFRL